MNVLRENLTRVCREAGFCITVVCAVGYIMGLATVLLGKLLFTNFETGAFFTSYYGKSLALALLVAGYYFLSLLLADSRLLISEAVEIASKTAEEMTKTRLNIWEVIEKNVECPVCLLPLGPNRVFVCRCTATAHAECVTTWWKHTPDMVSSCFVCRCTGAMVCVDRSEPFGPDHFL